jgi:hypothetical protein
VRVQLEQLLTGLRVQFRILPDVVVERLQIAEALGASDAQHLSLNFRDALHAQLMNLFGGEIGRRLMTHREAIPHFSIRQSP